MVRRPMRARLDRSIDRAMDDDDDATAGRKMRSIDLTASTFRAPASTPRRAR